MEQLSDELKKISGEFLENVQEAFGEELTSVILYGPAVRGEKSKDPHIHFLVVVEDNTPSELAHCAQYVKKWNKAKITVPLFLHPRYITQSLDTFPLEFMDMSLSYHVVYGEDVLAELTFDKGDVRNQCERELKGKLLHLRAEYISLRGNSKGLTDLVRRSLNTFRLVFSGALYLKSAEIPQKTNSLFEAVINEYELDASLFKKLSATAKGEIKVTDAEADNLFDLYVEELDKLSSALDNLSLDETE